MRGPISFNLIMTSVAVTTSSTPVVAANPTRKYLAIRNTGLYPIALGFNGSATLGGGWPLAAAPTANGPGEGVAWEASGVPTNAVTAIASGTASTVVVMEGF